MHFRDPKGCTYFYRGHGTTVLVLSPSYDQLAKAFRYARRVKLPSGPGFFQKTRDGKAATVVMKLSGGRALLLQVPVSLCSPDALRRLSWVVGLRAARQKRKTRP